MKNNGHTHVALEGSARSALPGARATGQTNPHSTIEVTLKLRRKRKLPELNGRPKQIMTREKLAATYGASDGDIGTVVKAFGKFGLKCAASSAATRAVDLSGTVADMEKAFQVKLFDYSHPEGGYRGRVGLVHVPVAVQGIVEGVFGLDNRRVARRRRQPIGRDGSAKALSSVPASWYKPAELASHYNYPTGDGSGQAVGLLEFGGGYFPSDLQQFCQLAGINPPAVNAISVDGTSTSSQDEATGEVMLDVEVVAGVCPKATIAVYFASWTERGWIKALDAALQDKKNNPGVISVSWGAPEDTNIWSNQGMKQLNQALLEAGHTGVTVCIAAGDDGSSDADTQDGHAHVDFPGSSPYVLAVGGTTVPQKGGSNPDIVWFEGDGLRQDNGGSTGGGVSAVFPRPAWQANVPVNSVNPGAIAGRSMPDLAANADWNASPYLLVVGGQAQPNGGTSAATPLVASLIALINADLQQQGKQRVGYLTPVLYQANGKNGSTVGSACCTDVTSGNNNTAKAGGYSAGPGYDAASGWGTPDGAKLLAALENQ
jgi:kumamolisin